jgi:hypothetical protein
MRRSDEMKRMILVISFALVSALSAGAQGRGQSATHSNAPTSTDRDKGTARAADVGKKEKKGHKKDKKDKDKGKKGNTPPTSKKS